MIKETREKNGDIVYKDEKDREIIRYNREGKGAIARYPDMTSELKDVISKIWFDRTGKNKDETLRYLDYKSEENEFCT
jgi:hypothetical protein